MFIVVATEERVSFLRAADMKEMTFIKIYNFYEKLKLPPTALMTTFALSPSVPCQFVLAFTGGQVILVEPKNYSDWLN